VSQCAQEFVIDLNELHTELHTQLTAAQKHYQGPVDHQQIPASDFKVGKQVFVKAENICTTHPSKKPSEKNLGPFDIFAQPGMHSVTIQLPDHLCAIHLVFHVSQLELATLNQIPNQTQPPPPPIKISGEDEYEIAAILDSNIDNQRRCKLLYFVC
jgi:hypothetical protein